MRTLPRTYARLAWLHALRRLKADWSYTLVAVLSVALGTALVALAVAWLDSTLWRTAGYPETESLWQVQIVDASAAAHVDDRFGALVQASGPMLREFLIRQQGFSTIGSGMPRTVRHRVDNGETKVAAFVVDESFFSVLGIQADTGRLPRSAHQEVLLTMSFARAHFGSAAAATGKMLDLDGRSYRIVGTLPARFVHPSPSELRRIEGATPTLYLAEEEPLIDTAQDSAELLILGKGGLGARALHMSVDATLTQIATRTGGSPAVALLRPLKAWMEGAEHRLAGRLLVLSALLLLTVLVTAAMTAAIRARRRARESTLLQMLGAGSTDSVRFTTHEAGWIAAAVFVTSACIFAVLCALAGLNAELGLAITARFLTTGGLVLLGEGALVLTMLQLVARTQGRRRTNGGHNVRGSPAPKMLRTLVTLQALTSLLLLSVALQASDYSLRTLRDALAIEAGDLYEVRVQMEGAHAMQRVSSEIHRIKQRAEANPGFTRSALLLSPPLDLFGSGVKYDGPRDVGGRVVNRSGNSIVIVRDQPPPGGGSESVSYQASVVAVEPAYFEMLGFPFLAGGAFKDEEENATVLTPQLRALLFPGRDAVGARVPAGPQIDSTQRWHNGLVVKGEVDARRIGRVGILGRMFSQHPLAFVPYSDRALPDDARTASVSVLLQSKMGPEQTLEWLHGTRSMLEDRGLRVETHRLADQIRERTVEHVLASLLGLAIIVIVMVSASLGAMSAMRQLCASRRSEIAIRMAIGEPESSIAMRLALREMFWPVIGICALAIVVALLPGALLPLPMAGNVGAAWILVLSALTAGILRPLYVVLRQSPARALQEE